MVPEAGKFCLEQNLAAQLACKAEHKMCEPPEPGTGSRHAKKFLTKGTLKRKTKMVPEAGLEPARPKERQILNLLCLPISPLGQSAFASAAKELWRRDPESNRTSWICNPEHNRFAITPFSEAAILAESFSKS